MPRILLSRSLLARLACFSRWRRAAADEVVLKEESDVGETCDVMGGEEAMEGELTGGEEAREGERVGREARDVAETDVAAGAGLGDNVICSSWLTASPLCIISATEAERRISVNCKHGIYSGFELMVMRCLAVVVITVIINIIWK